MPTVTVSFKKCIQDSQEYGSTDEHMVSRVFFDLEAEGKMTPNLSVDIRQVLGGAFEADPIEVTRPEGYRGPFNYNAFRDAVEAYYRSLVGSTGSGIRIAGGGNIRMRNNTFVMPGRAQFDADEGNAGW